jgi:hypothetical protein
MAKRHVNLEVDSIDEDLEKENLFPVLGSAEEISLFEGFYAGYIYFFDDHKSTRFVIVNI